MLPEGAPGERSAAALIDPAIAAWWADATITSPALPSSFDVTIAPPSSVQAAVDRCREGGSILLLPGAYEGCVILTKEVHVYGRGKATLQTTAEEGAVITSVAPAGTLDGLIVRPGPHAEGEWSHCGIFIQAGELLVRNCDVAGCISARGFSASPAILGCKVRGGNKAGIDLEECGEVRVGGCDIVGSESCGLCIFKSDAVITSNKIHGSKQSGVLVGGAYRTVRLEDNSIVENEENGVTIMMGADPSLVANRIDSNKRSGVLIYAAGWGRLERNTLRGNGAAGVWVGQQASGDRLWGDGNKFSGNGMADLVSNEGEGEAAHAGGQPAPRTAAPVAAPADGDGDLIRELECVVCKDIMLRPFLVCQHGHASACLPCYGRLGVCPVCRGLLLSPPCRMLLLEGLAKDVLVPCPHAADGCPRGALRYADAGAHADTCEWRKVLGASCGSP